MQIQILFYDTKNKNSWINTICTISLVLWYVLTFNTGVLTFHLYHSAVEFSKLIGQIVLITLIGFP